MKLDYQQIDDVLLAEWPEEVDFVELHRRYPNRYPYLLDSHHDTGFDILFACPQNSIRCTDLHDHSFFENVSDVLKKNVIPSKSDELKLPFKGGWFVFLSYELIGLIEPKLADLPVSSDLPIAQLTRIPLALIRQRKTQNLFIVCEQAYASLLPQIEDDLSQLSAPIKAPCRVSLDEDNERSFLSSVQRIKQYLYDGDTLQVNLSRQWQGMMQEGCYTDVYRSLSLHNPAPFSGLARFGETVVVSSSPERLVSISGDKVQMRPIAGTRPRHQNKVEDQRLAKELLENTKENAEHVMLIDLIRNDLGRVCKAGSVRVDETMTLESYATVHHIVSNVLGTLKPDVLPTDVIKAVFPGGTITGCPKVRCMEIINELEKTPRGAYTGSMGYINNNGDMDLNILIRSITISNKALSFRTGAGIVADSIPQSELEETRHKAKALLIALGVGVE